MVDVQFRRRFQLSRRDFGSRIIPLKHSLANRTIEPEILDELPANDPRAIASRRDLQLLNLWLGHRRIMSHALDASLWPEVDPHLVELGCGDGTFATRAIRFVPRGKITLVDRQASIEPRTLEKLRIAGW